MMVVNKQSWRLQRNNAQQKKNTAYYSVKGILSRDLDKAPHIIVPVVSECNPVQASVWGGMTSNWERSLLCVFCFFPPPLRGWLRPACCSAPGGTAHTRTHSGHHSANSLPHRPCQCGCVHQQINRGKVSIRLTLRRQRSYEKCQS